MKAMGYASPAKQRSGGIEMEPTQERGMKKELRRIKKKKPSTIEAEGVKVQDPKKDIVDTLPKSNNSEKNKKDEKALTAKEKALKALKDAQEDNEVSNIEKETSKVKKNSTKKRKQATRKDSQAERRAEKTKRLEARIERRKARRSPAKQAMQSGSNMTAAEKKAMNDKSAFGPDGKNVAKPPKGGSNTKADALFEKIVKRSTTAPKKGNKNVKGEKYIKSPAKQSKRTTRLQNKEAKETNKIIRGEKTSARKVNRLNDRLEVSKAKDKVKAVRKSQRAEKLKNKAAVLNNKAQG